MGVASGKSGAHRGGAQFRVATHGGFWDTRADRRDDAFMLTKIHIKNFRAFRDLEVGPFNKVNLIAGLNNTGKTGLLEALAIVLADQQRPGVPQAHTLPTMFRSFPKNVDENENFWRWLLRDKRAENEVKLTLTDNKLGADHIAICAVRRPNPFDLKSDERVFSLGTLPLYRLPGPVPGWPSFAVFSTHPSDPTKDAVDFNGVTLKRAKTKLVKLLKTVEPRLEAVEALQVSSAPMIYVDIGLPEMIPVTHLGAGFCRLLNIYSRLLDGSAGVLLIDEIENGLHHSVLPTVWKGLIVAANELNVQIFATTHSMECIKAADDAARAEPPHELNLIRLDRVKDDIKATVMDEKTFEQAWKFGWELR